MNNNRSYKILWLICLILCVSSSVYGTDIYVRPGSSGKGTKDSPYNVLWKAMDKALRGDVIHVTAGTYTAKGDSGAFIVRVPYLTMVGGYSDDFSSRDPFGKMTILKRAKDYKGDRSFQFE